MQPEKTVILSSEIGQQVRGVACDSPFDKRRGRRFSLRLPCRLLTGLGALNGMTENISRSGMLIQFERVETLGPLPSVGDATHILVDLPQSGHIAPRCLECWVTAVRTVESEPEHWSMAFQIHRTGICDHKGRPSHRIPRVVPE
jgi:hypothetical protein